jgi:hypothetical protein
LTCLARRGFYWRTEFNNVDSLVAFLWRINHLEWLPGDAKIMKLLLTSSTNGFNMLLSIENQNLLRFIKLAYSEADAKKVWHGVTVVTDVVQKWVDGGNKDPESSNAAQGLCLRSQHRNWVYKVGRFILQTLAETEIGDSVSWQRKAFGDSPSCWFLLEILNNLTIYVDYCLSGRSAVPAQQLDLVDLVRTFLDNVGREEGNYIEHPHWCDWFHKVRQDEELFNSCAEWCHSAIVALAGAHILPHTRKSARPLSGLQVPRKVPDSTASSILTGVGKAPSWSEIPVVELDAGYIGSRYKFSCTGEIEKHLSVDTSLDIIYIYRERSASSEFPGKAYRILKGNCMAQ